MEVLVAVAVVLMVVVDGGGVRAKARGVENDKYTERGAGAGKEDIGMGFVVAVGVGGARGVVFALLFCAPKKNEHQLPARVKIILHRSTSLFPNHLPGTRKIKTRNQTQLVSQPPKTSTSRLYFPYGVCV